MEKIKYLTLYRRTLYSSIKR